MQTLAEFHQGLHTFAMSTEPANAAQQPLIPEWTFGDKLRKARLTAGMEQRAFAAALEMKPGKLAAYETGRAAPRFRDAPALAKRVQVLTGIDYRWFLDAGPVYTGSAEPNGVRYLVPPVGFEPTAFCSGGRRSIP